MNLSPPWRRKAGVFPACPPPPPEEGSRDGRRTSPPWKRARWRSWTACAAWSRSRPMSEEPDQPGVRYKPVWRNTLPVPPMSLHLVSLGNPGTRRASRWARLLAQIYRAISALQGTAGGGGPVRPGGRICGADRPSRPRRRCSGPWAGALIDEALWLAASDQASTVILGGRPLRSCSKTWRITEGLIVIVAGYTEEMGRFIHAKSRTGEPLQQVFLF